MSAEIQASRAADVPDEWMVVDTRTHLRFLIIEDSPSDSELVRALLEDEIPNGELDVAISLKEALQHLSGSSYDLVLSDLTLPDAAGETVVRAVRRAAPQTPLIVLTGRVDGALALWTLAAGAQDYLVKGEHDGPQLAEAIMRALQRSLTEQLTHARLISALKLQSEAAERLRILDAARSDFVATANHELRTPLASIAAYAEVLQDTPGLSTTQAGFVDAIVRNAVRLSALTDDLLLLSNFTSEQLNDQGADVDMRAVVSASSEVVATLAAAQGIDVSYELADGSVLVYGDGSQLERVVLNLMTNAIKFTPAPGAVTCRVTTTQDDVVMTVTDTGVGISTEEQEQVFDKFFRGSWAREREVQGTGLGLHIAATIVRAHRGQIMVESAGRGTTLTVRLPLQLPDQPESAQGSAQAPETLTQLFLAILGLPDADPEAQDIAAMVEAALQSAQQTDQWELLEDALRFARERFKVRGWSDADRDTLAAALVEAATGSSANEGAMPPALIARSAGGSAVVPLGPPHLEPIPAAYLDRLIHGDLVGAMALVRRCLAEGMDAADILLDVLEPAQREVGRQWASGLLLVVQEHFCTAVTQLVMSELYPALLNGDVSRGRLVAVHAPGSLHTVGLRMVADVLESQGWAAAHVASDIEEKVLVSLLIEEDADLLLISASMPAQIPRLRTTIRAVREDSLTRHVKVVVGGRPFNVSPDLVDVVGADGWARDARAAVDVCTKLMGRAHDH